jgi:hypothetical protein
VGRVRLDKRRLLAAPDLTRESVKLCDCSRCGCELLTGTVEEIAAAMGLFGDSCPASLAGRLDDRPYCSRCLKPQGEL